KAAGEMRERIEVLVPQSRVWVGTFHGFCARTLRKYAPLVGIDAGFSIYDQNDRLRALKDLMEEINCHDPGRNAHPIHATISSAKNDLLTPEGVARRMGDVAGERLARLYKAYDERLKSASAVDFDDLLVHVVSILKEQKDVRAELDRRFRYVLVDEYQDTNLA